MLDRLGHIGNFEFLQHCSECTEYKNIHKANQNA